MRRPSSATSRYGAGAQPRGLTPSFVLRVFANWWKLVVPLGAMLSIAGGATVWLMHVPKFEGSALISIEAEAPFIAFEQGQFSKDPDRYVQTQIELLQGPVVLNPVLARPEVASIPEIESAVDPLQHLQENLSVRQVGESELYLVTYVASSANDAASVANVVVAEYLDLQNAQEQKRLHIVLKVLEDERLQRGKNVERLRQEVVDLAKEVTGKDPFGQGLITDPIALAPMAGLYQSLTEAEVDYEVLNAEVQGLKNSAMLAEGTEIASGYLDLEISNRSDVGRLEERLVLIREQLAELKSAARLRIGDTWQDDPKYQQLTEQEQEITKELQDLKSVVRQELLDARRKLRNAEQANQLAVKKAAIVAVQRKREMLRKKLKAQTDKVSAGGARSAELEFKRAELEREQNVFELIAARKLALQTEQRAPARVTLMQEARRPQTSIEPIPYKHLLLACSLGLLAPLSLAVAFEALSRRISSSEDLTQEAALPVLGELARFPRQHLTGRHALALPGTPTHEAYVFAESVDSLRTQLMLTEQVGVLGSQRVVAVCSAASGEGKSSLATSLALSLAEATKRPTLLIDADLRSPDIANFLKVPSRPGICEVIDGKTELEKAIHRVGNSSAYVLPAGRLKGNPHHVFEGFKIEKLLTALRDNFDTILIDTPPVLAASDALVYAKAADLVLFCSLADTSRASQVRIAVERLRGTGANVAGAVLSGVSVGSYVFRYGSYRQDD
jgi:polysaccharide biosynthesis transport protein